jgi:serine/threonine protein kinase
MCELKDDDCPEAIRDFVRKNGDINIYEYIQRGSNGRVYFGHREKMGDDVVLKFYDSTQNYDESEEAVVLRKIKHKNIIEIFDLKFINPCFAYFLTPKILGGDLQSKIDNNLFTTKTALKIISEILEGLTELHSIHNLVHRDLKPANILLDENNSPKIADLGAVKKIDSHVGFVSESKATFLYLPPEAIIDKKYYIQSDIYQIGIILYQLLGGYFPVHDSYQWLNKKEIKEIENISDVFIKQIKYEEIFGTRIIKGKLVDINKMPCYIDNSFKKVIKKAINPDLAKRYSDTSSFLNDIIKLIRNNPDYSSDNTFILINHGNGKQFKIYKDNKDKYIIEKSIKDYSWRKILQHDGSIQAVLSIARKG